MLGRNTRSSSVLFFWLLLGGLDPHEGLVSRAELFGEDHQLLVQLQCSWKRGNQSYF